jgi:hypothetical protein
MTDHHPSPGHHDPRQHAAGQHAAGEVVAGDQSSRPQYDDVNTGVILMVGLISAIVTFLIIGFVQGLTYRWEAYFNQSRVEIVNRTVKAEVDAQKAILNSTNVPDGQPAEQRITIGEAMKRTYEKYKQPAGTEKSSSSSQTANSGEEVASGE